MVKIEYWRTINVEGKWMIQHIPSGDYIGGKSVVTTSKMANSPKTWKFASENEANRKLWNFVYLNNPIIQEENPYK